MSTPLFRLPEVARVVRLSDGRRLGYAEYGDPEGRPVFFFHGLPGSRLTLLPDDAAAREMGLRIIAPERPGYGLSDFQPGRRLLDWPADVVALAVALHIERFAVIGVSGGAPHALACAVKLPGRLTHCLLISPLAPTTDPRALHGLPLSARLAYDLGHSLSFELLQLALRPIAKRAVESPEQLIPRMLRFLPDSDREALLEPTVAARMRASQVEAYRPGPAATAWDTHILLQPWGFDFAAIRIPIHLWHGELDTIVPVALARHLEHTLPNCTATYLPAEGHFILYRHWTEVLQRCV